MKIWTDLSALVKLAFVCLAIGFVLGFAVS